jgi:hypothetical protein
MLVVVGAPGFESTDDFDFLSPRYFDGLDDSVAAGSAVADLPILLIQRKETKSGTWCLR